MVNERTNIVKFNFENNSLEISTDTPESGSGKDFLISNILMKVF